MRVSKLLFLLVSFHTIFHPVLCDEKQTESEEDNILCPFLKTLQPDTSSNEAIVKDAIEPGNMGGLVARNLVYTSLVLQQGIFAPLRGDVLDLTRLDEIPIISHPDLYTTQYDGVAQRLTDASDAEGYVSLQDLVEVKKWVAEVTNVRVTFFAQLETMALFLGANGNLGEDKVLAEDLLRFIRSDWDVNEFGNVSLFDTLRARLMARFWF